jgi:UDP-glucose 4-epimerase
MSRRILVTGADTFWGGRAIQAFESDPEVEVILGMGNHPPSVRFERAEFVHADQAYSLLSRIVRATQVDTIVHTSLVVDSTRVSSRALHEINVIGTLNLLAAAGGSGCSVRHVVIKSSSLVYGSTERDPATFTETTPRSAPPRTRVERSLVEAEALVRDFDEDNPGTLVTVLRFANVLGGGLVTPISKNLSRPVCPAVLGFDPLLQFVQDDDVVRALEHVTTRGIAGVYNVAGPGRLPWSEVASIVGTRLVPLPPWRPAAVVAPLVRMGVFELPPELEALLRYGRGVDTRRIEACGFRCRHSSAGAVKSFAQQLHLRRWAGKSDDRYTYEHDVEQFFRHSSTVVKPTDRQPSAR